MKNDIFDFGFTAVDEDELTTVQQLKSAATQVECNVVEAQGKLDKLYNAIVPLLNNLKANPEKEYILWPNRTEKIEAFEKKLFDIYKG